jgi:predicted TIM-barrel enzyme
MSRAGRSPRRPIVGAGTGISAKFAEAGGAGLIIYNSGRYAGVMGTDSLRRMDYLLGELDALGFSGINNFPTVGLIDGRFRMELERTAMRFGKEVDMIRAAHGHGDECSPFNCSLEFPDVRTAR